MTHVLDNVLDTLQHLPQVTAEVLEQERGPALYIDATILITTPQGQQRYLVEVTDYTSRAALPALLTRLAHLQQQHPHPTLLVSRYFSEPVIDALLEAGIEFADTAGNVHLCSEVGFILVRGQRAQDASTHKPQAAFTLAGLKVVYVLLQTPALRNAPYRDIQRASGVALGTISKTIKALQQGDYLVRTRSGTRQLPDFSRLLHRWDIGYLEQIRPSLHPSAWRLPHGHRLEHFADSIPLPKGCLLGGELAASWLSDILRPETVTLHVPDARHRRVPIELALIPVEERAQLHMLTHFTPSDSYQDAPQGRSALADPLLIRAELLARGGERMQETADALLHEVLLPREKRDQPR